MRVLPVTSYTNSYKLKRTNIVKSETPQISEQTNPSFKSWKGSVGAAAGAIIGAGVGALLSGGLLAPMLLSMAGSVVGGISADTNDGDDGGYDTDPTYPNPTDY